MSVYFFHFRNGSRQFMPDLYGETLPDLSAAKAAARRTAREMLQGRNADRWRGWRVDVVDEAGVTVSSTPVFDASRYH